MKDKKKSSQINSESDEQYNKNISKQMKKAGDIYSSQNNYEQALQFYERAAELGNCAAQEHLAYLYLSGEIIKKDYTQAYFWLQKAAAQNSAGAKYGLGFMFENGLGVDPDYDKARILYEDSAKNGYYEAYYRLGLFYFTGILGKTDYNMAFQLWKIASSSDALNTISVLYFNAKYCLSCMYLYGLGTDKDIEKSEKLWQECREYLKQEDKDEIDQLFAEIL